MKKLIISFEDMGLDSDVVDVDPEMVKTLDAIQPNTVDATAETEYSDVDEMELSSSMENFIELESKEFDMDNRAIDTSNALHNLGNTILNNNASISTESLALMGQFAVAGTGMEANALICKASFENKKVAIENIAEKIGAAIVNIFAGILKIGETILPVLRSFYTFFSFQKKTANDLIKKINSLDDKQTFNVKIKGSRFFLYGTGQIVESGSEYTSKAKETSDFVSASNAAAITFTKSRFLSKTKATLSAIALGAFKDSLFFDMYSHLQNDLLQPLSKLPGMKISEENKQVKQYHSDILLGGLELNVKIANLPVPKTKDDLSTTIKNTIGVVPLNTVSLDNTLGSKKSSDLSLDFTKSELLDLANQSLKLAIECEKHIDLNIKWNLGFSDQIKSMLEKFTNIPYTLITQCLATVRIVRLGAYLTSTMLGATFAACKSLIANNFKIINQAFIGTKV